MIKDKHSQLDMKRLIRRISAVLMGVIIASSMMPSMPAYAASNKSKTDTEETVSTPIREAHRVKVGKNKYCFFVQHNVVLTPSQVSKLSDNELVEEIVKQSGLFMKETNCRKVSHKVITYKSWIKQDHSFGLTEADIERIRGAAPSDGAPVKLHMDLGVSTDPAPEEKTTDDKTSDDKSKGDTSKDDKSGDGQSSEDTGKDDKSGDNTDSGDSAADDSKQGTDDADSKTDDNTPDNADAGNPESAAADDQGSADKNDQASAADDSGSKDSQESGSDQSDKDNKDSDTDNTDNTGADDQQDDTDPGEDTGTGDDDKETKKTDDRKFYSTSKLLSPELLFVVVATKSDAAKGEDICTLKTTDKEPSDDVEAPDTGGEKEDMLPEYRTIQMADRSGKPLEPTLQDGTPVTLKWVEPKKTINTDDMPSFLQHIPGGLAGLIGIFAAIAAAAAVIIIRRRAAADGYEYEDDEDEE